MTNPAELGKYILAAGKKMIPDRFPRPDTDTARLWGEVLAKLPLPAEIWPEAVKVYCVELVGDRMATPRDLKQAAYIVRDRWEEDPVRREQLESNRRRLQAIREQQLRDGTFAQVRGYKPRRIRQAPAQTPGSLGQALRGMDAAKRVARQSEEPPWGQKRT